MSDEAPVPLAEQIAVIKGPIAFAEHSVCYWADYPKSSAYIAATGNLRALRAVLATLQQHERAMAVVEAARKWRASLQNDGWDEREIRDIARPGVREISVALAALDEAASAAVTATPAGKGETPHPDSTEKTDG